MSHISCYQPQSYASWGLQSGYQSACWGQQNYAQQLMGCPSPAFNPQMLMMMPLMLQSMQQMMQMMSSCQPQAFCQGPSGVGPGYQMPCPPQRTQCPCPYPQPPYGHSGCPRPNWDMPYPCPPPCPPRPPVCDCPRPPRPHCPEPQGETRKMWDVWFDSKDGQKTVQRSPIVLDLNNNGKADITGRNITGDGRIDGPTTMFDLDPDKVSYEFKSQQRRPGSGAPAVKGGYWVNAEGERAEKGPPKGTQKKFNGWEYRDKDGNTVGEMKDGLYHYGKQEKREVTEWLKKDGGDGFLVADLNGDGQINSAVELFGTEGTKGSKYKNGYEKLGALYDRNRDGVVSGNEMRGLQVWVDKNADGQVQQGELQSLQQHNITSFNVGNYNGTTMEGSYTVGGRTQRHFDTPPRAYSV